MFRIITTAAAAAVSLGLAAGLLATAAPAQTAQFSGSCTQYSKAGEAACVATQWCRWQVSKSSPTLPNGQPNASCVFKPGHKAGWQSQASVK